MRNHKEKISEDSKRNVFILTFFLKQIFKRKKIQSDSNVHHFVAVVISYKMKLKPHFAM